MEYHRDQRCNFPFFFFGHSFVKNDFAYCALAIDDTCTFLLIVFYIQYRDFTRFAKVF
jgi:hypothetical protein